MTSAYRPVFFAAVAFLSGAIVGWSAELNWLIAAVASCAFFVAAIALLLAADRTGMVKWLLAAAVFLAGCASMQYTVSKADWNVEGEYALTGRVTEVSRNSKNTVVRLSEVKIEQESLNNDVFITFYDEKIPETDDYISIPKAKLSLPKKRAYRFAFDDRQYCAANNVLYRATCEGFVVTGHAHDVFAAARGARATIGKRLDELYGSRSSIVKALILGDTESVTDVENDGFIASGISHVLALSGLHIGIIIFGLFYFLKRIKAPYYLTIVLTLTALLAYLMLTGMKISAVRAGVLCVCVLLSQCAAWKYDSMTGLAIAFFAVVLPNPAVIFDLGFQFSFSAVFGIICVSPDGNANLYDEKMPTAKDKFLGAIRASAAVTVCTLPYVANVNNYFWMPSLLLNLAVIPFVSAALPVLLVLSALYLIFPGVFLWAGAVGGWIVDVLRFFAGGSDWLPEFGVELPSTYPLAALIVLAGVWLVSKTNVFYSRKWMRAAAGGFCAAAAIICFVLPSQWRGDVQIVFLNGGDKCSAVVSTAAGGCAVIDAGADIYGYAVKNSVVPQKTVITKGDTDHAAGLDALVSGGRAGSIYTGEDGAYALAAKYSGEKITALSEGDMVAVDENTCIEIKYVSGKSGMVARLVHKGRGLCLFMTDAALYDEGLIGGDISAEILVAGRNGKDGSTGRGLTDRVGQDYTVIQSARGGSAQVLDRLGSGFVYNTGENGQITFTADGDRIEAEAMYETW